MNRLAMIVTLFNNDKDQPIDMPERTSTKIARVLEAELVKDMQPVIQSYQDGMISTAEFIGKILLIADEEIKL